MGLAIRSRRRYTVQEYLALEAAADERHEFRDGEILNMPGTTFGHEGVVSNAIRRLAERLDGTPCLVRGSNLKVRVDQNRYCYPDVTITCDTPAFDPSDEGRTLTNPRVIIEVLSPSTEAADRGEKFRRYIRLPSLQEYLLVAQDQPRVETIYRHPDGMWAFAPWAEGLEATLRIRTLGIEIPLGQLYASVTFPPAVEADEQLDGAGGG